MLPSAVPALSQLCAPKRDLPQFSDLAAGYVDRAALHLQELGAAFPVGPFSSSSTRAFSDASVSSFAELTVKATKEVTFGHRNTCRRRQSNGGAPRDRPLRTLCGLFMCPMKQ